MLGNASIELFSDILSGVDESGKEEPGGDSGDEAPDPTV